MIREIEAKVRAVRRRLRVLRFYRAALWGASLATGVSALAFLTDKAFKLPWSEQEKWMAWGGLMAVGFLVALIYAVLSRLTLFDASLAVDLRHGLQERFSSAILLRDRADDPAVAALVADTHRFCRKLHPRDDFPFLLPSRYAHHVWPFLALAGIHFLVPRMNLFASADQGPATKQEIVMPKPKREEQAEKIEKMAKKIRENADGEANEDLLKFAKDLDKIAEDLKTGQKNPKLALAEMSRISEEVRLERNDLARKFEGYQNISTPMAGQFTSDMQQALQRNEFEKAAQMARNLAAKATAESSALEKEQAARELQNLAEQLKKDQPDMAQAMQQAAQAMQQAAQQQSQGDQSGMEKSVAQAQEALQQAASEMNNQAEAAQTMERLDQLQQSMEQQKREMARSMGLESPVGLGQMPGSDPSQQSGQAEGQASQGQQPGQQSGQNDQQGGRPGQTASASGQSGQDPSGSQGAGHGRPSNQGGQDQSGSQPGGQSQVAQGGAQFGQGAGNVQGASDRTGAWQPGQSEAQGPGMGGPGQGRGGRAPFDDSNAPSFVDTRPPGEKNPGEIIAVLNVDAPALKGESKIEYQNVFTEYKQKADDAMSREDIPASLQPMVRDYFDAISPEAFDPKDAGAQPQPAANP